MLATLTSTVDHRAAAESFPSSRQRLDRAHVITLHKIGFVHVESLSELSDTASALLSRTQEAITALSGALAQIFRSSIASFLRLTNHRVERGPKQQFSASRRVASATPHA